MKTRHDFTRGRSQPYLRERSAYTEAKDWHSGDQLAKNSTIHVTRPSLASSSCAHTVNTHFKTTGRKCVSPTTKPLPPTLPLVLTSIVLSLKYLMYSGPMYRGGLQVIKNTETHRRSQHLTLSLLLFQLTPVNCSQQDLTY